MKKQRIAQRWEVLARQFFCKVVGQLSSCPPPVLIGLDQQLCCGDRIDRI
jgi:hypothetical protein